MLEKTLQLFEPVTLDVLNARAALQKRVDKKFLFPVSFLEEVLMQCVKDYQVLCINNSSFFVYTTKYYDTDELAFYHHHHNGKGNRCKVRTRSYENSGLKFVEVKQKNNKGKTIKYRTGGDDIYAADSFVKQYSGFDSAILKNSVTIQYERITLLHKLKTEKITFDLLFTCRQNDNSRGYDNVVMAEVKTEKSNSRDFCAIMKAFGIKSGILSKYCLGLISMNEQIKHNNFKRLFTKLVKLNTGENV